MSILATINGKEIEFADQAAADEATANAANTEAARLMLAAATGGTKYRAEAFGLAIVRYCVEAAFKASKTKAKDITAAAVFEAVSEVTEDTLNDALAEASKLIQAFGTLTGKHQAPLKGGTLPKRVAEAFAVVVKPETGAAQRETATAVITAAV